MDQFETLYRQHASAVFRFTWGLCGNRSCAEDLVSETFVRLLTKTPRIRTRTALAYLLAVARNTYLNGQRRRNREVELSDEIASPQSDPAGRLDDRIDDRARLETILVALGDLPEGERAALLLRIDHELPYEEIAAALDISVGAAKVRVHRARLKLAGALEKSGGNHEYRNHA
jgi:RNA polymerase sigma-70 factor (ECF subfamily)